MFSGKSPFSGRGRGAGLNFPSPTVLRRGGSAAALIASGAVTAASDGQLIEYLDITADGNAIDLNGKSGVTIRFCRITHNVAGLGGAGIIGDGAADPVIEDCEIINAGAPDRGASPTDDDSNIQLTSCGDPTISRVTLRQGSSGIYALSCGHLTLNNIEGHDMRGPFPRGQLVQANKCAGITLDGWSYESIPGTSKDEDNINIFSTPGAAISDGRIPFCSDSQTGVGIMVEPGDGDGSEGARIDNVEIGYYFNGAFSVYGTNDVQFTNMRVRHVLPYSVNGAPSSDGGAGPLMVAVADGPLTDVVVSVKYDDVNEANLLVEDDWVTETLTEEDWTPTVPLVRNEFFWRDQDQVPVEDLPVRIVGGSDPPLVGETLYLLPGRYTNDPTSRAWQWYADDVAISGATGLSYILQAGEEGAVITVGETPSNAAGAGSEYFSDATAEVETSVDPNPNLLTFSDDLTNAAWTNPLGVGYTITADQEAPDGRTMDRFNNAADDFNIRRRTFNYAGGVPYTLSCNADQGTGRYLGLRIKGSKTGERYPTFDLQTDTFNDQGIAGVTGGVGVDAEGLPRYWITYIPTAGSGECDVAIVTSTGATDSNLSAATTFIGKVKLEQAAEMTPWVEG